MDKYTQRGVSGEVDVEASAKAYADALTKWASEHEVATDDIASAVNTVLDRHTGRIPMPALLSLAVTEMGATPETFKVLTDRVHAYVTGQAKAELLFVTRGKGGGVGRERPVKKDA